MCDNFFFSLDPPNDEPIGGSMCLWIYSCVRQSVVFLVCRKEGQGHVRICECVCLHVWEFIYTYIFQHFEDQGDLTVCSVL